MHKKKEERFGFVNVLLFTGNGNPLLIAFRVLGWKTLSWNLIRMLEIGVVVKFYYNDFPESTNSNIMQSNNEMDITKIIKIH